MGIPEEIIEGRYFLEQADKEADLINRLACLQDGLDLIESYLDDYTDKKKDILTLINNLKRAHIRTTIDHLHLFQNLEMGIWLDNILFFNCRLEFELYSEMQQDQNLKRNYNRFESLWINVFKKVLSNGTIVDGKFYK